MNKRNLNADLEVCNKATKGPWRVNTNAHPETTGESWGWIDGPVENYCWTNRRPQSRRDAEFIAQAREGWPHAIERALKAEALVRELVDTLNLAQESLHENGIGIVDDRQVMKRAKEVL